MNSFYGFRQDLDVRIFGVAAAYLEETQPPPVRLLGKSPDYVKIYGHTYQNELRKNQMVFSGKCVLP